ncbi:MAG: hypothetical protein QXM86_04330 [Candidatus Bathyarchaeia archaeon]
MKNGKNEILALILALLIALPMAAIMFPNAKADNNESDNEIGSVEPVLEGLWYKFETPLITLIFPAKGTKPMFLWWYTNDNDTIYVVKFQGIIEYLILDKPYYRHRFQADNATINATLWGNYIEPVLRQKYYNIQAHRWKYQKAISGFFGLLLGLHRAYLPFSACNWTLTGPTLVENENSTYWSFNFTLTEVHGHNKMKFAENNIQIRCRFYNTTTTKIPDKNQPDYNYTVAAGQLKFDFVVSNWEWNIDKINNFLDEYNVTIPVNRTGLALWINMASIELEDLPNAEKEVQYEAEHREEAQVQVENGADMQNVMIGGEYCVASQNETSQDEKPVQATLQIRERFRERIRAYFACGKTDVPVGFLEFVPWARILDDEGNTIEYANVTASYVAAGGHIKLFICYPYFNSSYTLEHDPTIGLDMAPPTPSLVGPGVIIVLLGATVAIAVAVAAVKLRKKTINIVNVH